MATAKTTTRPRTTHSKRSFVRIPALQVHSLCPAPPPAKPAYCTQTGRRANEAAQMEPSWVLLLDTLIRREVTHDQRACARGRLRRSGNGSRLAAGPAGGGRNPPSGSKGSLRLWFSEDLGLPGQ